MKTITINGLTINADFKKLAKEIKNLYPIQHDIHADESVEENNAEEDSGFHQTVGEWNECTTRLEEGLEDLENRFETIASESLVFTKKNRLALNRRQVLLAGDHIIGYSDHHGSHQYNYPIIEVILLKDNEAVLILSSKLHQSPF